ncbi:MAG: heme-degrading domain-containing protein [Eubacteriaceae bacterium]|nr:heme-degrading domain-containing protein [Eubacteriaceae bacterium]
MDEYCKLLNKIAEQEEKLKFSSFNSINALELGLQLIELGKKQSKPIAIDIRVNGHQLFHYSFDMTSIDNDQWILRKARVVERFGRSSLYMGTKLKIEGKTVEEKYNISSSEFAFYGGSFPINLKDTGTIGAITVSGLKQTEDHDLVVEGITLFTNRKE